MRPLIKPFPHVSRESPAGAHQISDPGQFACIMAAVARGREIAIMLKVRIELMPLGHML